MPLIPKLHVKRKETLQLRIERELNEELIDYAAFVDSPKDYIVDAALRRLFKHDKEFSVWREQRRASRNGGSTANVDTGSELGAAIDVEPARGQYEPSQVGEQNAGRTGRRVTAKESA